jgi:hypothetical protein
MMKNRLTLLCTLMMLAPLAQSQEWDFKVAPYLWAAGIDGSLTAGQQSGDFSVGFDDIVNVLDGAIIVRFEAQKGRHGFFGDIVKMNLDPDTGRAGPGGPIGAEVETLIIEGGYSYGFTNQLAGEIGLTYWDFETSLFPPNLPVSKSSADWVDILAGIRYTVELGEKWESVTRFNLATGGADVVLGLDQSFLREFANGNQLLLGFRLLNTEYDKHGIAGLEMGIDATFAGATIGYVFD